VEEEASYADGKVADVCEEEYKGMSIADTVGDSFVC
jgi:hypothetical protein